MSLDHLVAGAVYGLTLAIIAIAVPRFTRQILAAALIVAGMFYAGFAVEAHASAAWLATELAGVGIFGYAAMRGTRGSAWWLVAGWALHPVWDIALHYAGSGRGLAPEWYTTSCLTFDLMVASLVAIAILIGTHLTVVPSATPVVLPLRPSSCTCGSTSTCTASGARAA
jgi:hypothetical protein